MRRILVAERDPRDRPRGAPARAYRGRPAGRFPAYRWSRRTAPTQPCVPSSPSVAQPSRVLLFAALLDRLPVSENADNHARAHRLHGMHAVRPQLRWVLSPLQTLARRLGKERSRDRSFHAALLMDRLANGSEPTPAFYLLGDVLQQNPHHNLEQV